MGTTGLGVVHDWQKRHLPEEDAGGASQDDKRPYDWLPILGTTDTMDGGPVEGPGLQLGLAPLLVPLVQGARNTYALGWGWG
mmetsp:Transcript_18222/g.32406  ORF Transcript_18222/g.32406 Transcript_18222/m.32406 type:complete len:82 (-) Transcript_18222:168-413(-)